MYKLIKGCLYSCEFYFRNMTKHLQYTSSFQARAPSSYLLSISIYKSNFSDLCAFTHENMYRTITTYI
jgi:hypothetical protein